MQSVHVGASNHAGIEIGMLTREEERGIGKYIHGKQLYLLQTYTQSLVGELRENILSQTRLFIS